MKKLNITKEQFNRSNYFRKKYGKLEYVSESGNLFKTDKGKVLKFNESKKLVKEGAGAGYTVTIKDLKFGKIIDYKFAKDEDTYKVKVEVAPGVYEIAAQDYYNDFFWQEHEFGDTPTAQIDGGYAIFDIALDGNPDEDDEALFQMNRELENRKLDISFDYGWGWTHANLPKEEIEADHVDIEGRDVYFGIDKLVLNAPDLADAVNSGFQSTFDQGEDAEENEDGEPMDESIIPNKGNEKTIKVSWRFFRQLENIIGKYYGENPENLDLVAEKALKYLAQCGAKKVKGEDPRDVKLSIRMPDEDDDDFRLTKSVYQVVEEVAENNISINESYNPNKDDGRKRVMNALEEFRQVLWDDTKVDDEDEHNLRRSLYQDVDNAISQAIQKYFKYSRI